MHTVVNSFRENISMIPFPRYLNPQGGVRIGRLLEDMDVFAVHLVFKHVLNPRQVTKSSSCPLHIFWTLSGRRSGIAFLHCDCSRRPDWLHSIFQVLPSHVQNDYVSVFQGRLWHPDVGSHYLGGKQFCRVESAAGAAGGWRVEEVGDEG